MEDCVLLEVKAKVSSTVWNVTFVLARKKSVILMPVELERLTFSIKPTLKLSKKSFNPSLSLVPIKENP